MTLMEMMVAIGCGSLVFVVLGAVSLYSARSFSSMVEYSDLNKSSRMALDKMSKDIRQSRGVKSFVQSTNGNSTLVFKVTTNGSTFSLIYDKSSKTLTQLWPGVKTNDLNDCTSFSFDLFSRSPSTNAYKFVKTTNAAECKIVQLNWKCERKATPNTIDSDSVQSMQITIRKRPS